MQVELRDLYQARQGRPFLNRVDTEIFEYRYYGECMACTFCFDRCCSFGADVDLETRARILSHAGALEEMVGVPREEWFYDVEVSDPEYPGDAFVRTRVTADRCIFLDRSGRGCKIHKYCIERGLDFRLLKPLICTLFPVTFEEGLLRAANEVRDQSLVCCNGQVSVYEGCKSDLQFHFGEGLVDELDALERKVRLSA
jgi:Fe-S-cluster containining protein